MPQVNHLIPTNVVVPVSVREAVAGLSACCGASVRFHKRLVPFRRVDEGCFVLCRGYPKGGACRIVGLYSNSLLQGCFLESVGGLRCAERVLGYAGKMMSQAMR